VVPRITRLIFEGILNGKVYRNTPHTAEAPQNEIRDVTALILGDNLQHVRRDPFEDVMRV
jgi:hypothetical protein